MRDRSSIDLLGALGCAVDIRIDALPTHCQSPIAIVYPTTSRTLAVATDLQQRGLGLVVGENAPGYHSPANVLETLRAGSATRHWDRLIVFSDQIVRPSDAFVLVRTDQQSLYFSAFEAVLNIKYGYNLEIWNTGRFVSVEASQVDSQTIFRNLVTHLLHCTLLEEAWLAKRLQRLRSPEIRKTMASQKLRALKSSVLDSLSESDNLQDGISILNEIAGLERRLTAGSPE